jgi:hypothetical protein
MASDEASDLASGHASMDIAAAMRRQEGSIGVVVSKRKPVSADDLQDFIEGRLSGTRLREVEAYLQAHPAEARRVEALREQASRLRRLGSEMLTEPVPAQFLDILKRLKN